MSVPPRYAAILLAGGSGARVGAVRNKVYLDLAGRPVIHWSLKALAGLPGLVRLVVVVRPEDLVTVHSLLRSDPTAHMAETVIGGDTRHESESNALEHLAASIEAGEIDVVLVHDAARPCVTPELVQRVAETAVATGGAVPGIEIDERLYSLDGGPAPTTTVVRTQTPQAFWARPLLEAYRAAAADEFHGTDTARSIERYTDLEVAWVPGERLNVKVTFPEDLFVAELCLKERGK